MGLGNKEILSWGKTQPLSWGKTQPSSISPLGAARQVPTGQVCKQQQCILLAGMLRDITSLLPT